MAEYHKVFKDTKRELLAKECVKVERQGGDVIAYLKGKGYIYSTRSTWENLQRSCLHREGNRITDGSPKEVQVTVNRRRKNWDGDEFREIAIEAVKIAKGGDDPRVFLQSKGYMDTATAWMKAKTIYRTLHPGEEIPTLGPKKKLIETYTPGAVYKHGFPYGKNAEGTPKDQTGISPSRKPDAPEPPKSGKQNGKAGGYVAPEEVAKAAAKMMGEKTGYSREVTTCCAPARESGVTVPEEIPESTMDQVKPEKASKKISGKKDDEMKKDGTKPKMKVVMVETDLGTFKKEGDSIVFKRNDSGKDYNNTLQMLPSSWRKLVAEMDEVLEILETVDAE